jgi:hypothetical protein
MARSTGKAPRAGKGGQYAPAGGRVVKVHGTKGKTKTGTLGHQSKGLSTSASTVKAPKVAMTGRGKGGHQAVVNSTKSRVVTVGGSK